MTMRRSYFLSAILLAIMLAPGTTNVIIDGFAQGPYPPPATSEPFAPWILIVHLPWVTRIFPPPTASSY